MDSAEPKLLSTGASPIMPSRPHPHQATDSMVSVSLSSPDLDSKDVEFSAKTLPPSQITTPKLAPVTDLDPVPNDSPDMTPKPQSRPFQQQQVFTPGVRVSFPRPSSVSSGGSPRSSNGSDDSEQVDWNALDKTEKEEKGDSSDESTSLLLARLEQENDKLATDPKSKVQPASPPGQSRSPSLEQLKELIEKNPEDVRFSLFPAPPPMRELDFWLALTRDYTETAHRLPTLTITKIRSGIPIPLRGEVWKSIVGARDIELEEQYEKLRGISSPHEDRIDKDVGRTFPDHDFFNNPGLPGQKMLWNVLKCYSLYNAKIGYCQGLGFPVGTLLLQMEEKEAFCVFVRLMEKHDLTDCFAAPDLPGLPLRMYQYHRLLHRHLPQLAKHLDDLQVNPVSYFPKWLLSLFAASCPQPLLVRIWDVMFVEGAIETVMRVGLAIMRRNQQTLLSLSEMDHVLPILLSRKMWDAYYPTLGDELVRDFVSLSANVTRDILLELQTDYNEAQKNGLIAELPPQPEVQSAALRFLGRLWSASSPSTKSTSLSPGFMPPRRSSSFFVRGSKASVASSVNSLGAPSLSSTSLASTAPTETSFSRYSSVDDSPKSQSNGSSNGLRIVVPSKESEEDKQIEELLLALSDAQRQNDNLETQIRKKEEERREDCRMIKQLLDKLQSSGILASGAAPENGELTTDRQSRRRTTVSGLRIDTSVGQGNSAIPEELAGLVEKAAARFTIAPRHSRNSSMFETKDSLRASLSRTKDLLAAKTSQCDSLNQQIKEHQDQTRLAQEALREVRQRLQDSFNKQQQLEKTISDLKTKHAQQSSRRTPDSSPPPLSRSNTSESTSGLRELKLARSSSSRSIASRREPAPTPPRTSSLNAQRETRTGSQLSQDELLAELIATKTSEALAKNELAELQRKYDTLRRSANALAAGGNSLPTPAATPSNGGGGFWSSWGRRAPSVGSVTVGGSDTNSGK